MKVIYTSGDGVDIGDHPWNLNKYRLIADRIVEQGWIEPGAIIPSSSATEDDILRTHSTAYYMKLCELDFTPEELELLELPITTSFVDFAWRMTGGTLHATQCAMDDGIAAHIGGGFHHAKVGNGAGFCLINDIAVSIQALLDEGRIGSALVIDCDVHQGDGTAAIFRDDPRVFTFSIHQRRGFPYFKVPGTLDIELEDDTGDGEYLDTLSRALDQVFSGRQFDLVHYQAGVDPYEHDVLGNLMVSEEGLRKRDVMVIGRARSLGIPLIITLGGGYTPDVQDVAKLHANTIHAAAGRSALP